MKKLFFLLTGILLLYSCTPEVELGTPFQAGQQVSLTAHMPGGNTSANQLPGKQRVSGVDAGAHINLVWDEGDVVLVTVDGHTAEFTLESGAGSATGTFTGTMPASGTTYSVQYPVSEPDLSNQTYVESGFGKGLMKMTATDGTIDGGFTLAAQNALFSLQLTGDQALGNIVLTNPANSKTYTLNCSGVTLTSAEQLFYFVVPAETWASGFTVDVYGSDNTTKIKTLTKSSSVTFTAGGAMVMPTQKVVTVVQRVGIFSVGESKKAIFSSGNLQYDHPSKTWSFAANQYDRLGYENDFNAKNGGKIDLFGWSGSIGVEFGIKPTSTGSENMGGFIDWGENEIGSDPANAWRTLTSDEWKYLIADRPNASSLCGVAQINKINGLVLLPDDYYSYPSDVEFKPGFSDPSVSQPIPEYHYKTYQEFSLEQWKLLEAAGAVFLPAAGSCSESYGRWSVGNLGIDGYYWSSTEDGEYVASSIWFNGTEVNIKSRSRSYGNSVRLVKVDGDVPIPEEPHFRVSKTHKVIFAPGNLQYTQSTKKWSFAEHQYDCIGEANVVSTHVNGNVTKVLGDKIDLFGWSGSTGSVKFGISMSKNEADYSGQFKDWGSNQINGDPANVWRTLTRDEWKYLITDRPNASSLCGVARINDINGLILLPHNWVKPNGIEFKPGFSGKRFDTNYTNCQSYTIEQWEILESAGAIFLPDAGDRYNVASISGYGRYWSSSSYNEEIAEILSFNAGEVCIAIWSRCYGLPVRLVKPI